MQGRTCENVSVWSRLGSEPKAEIWSTAGNFTLKMKGWSKRIGKGEKMFPGRKQQSPCVIVQEQKLNK